MATSKELKSGVDEALKIRDALQVALGQEGLTDAEFTSINNQYKAAVKTFDKLDAAYKKAQKSEGLTAGETERETAFQTQQVKFKESAAIDAAKAFQDNPNDKTRKAKNTAYETLNDFYNKADAAGVKLPRIIAPITGGGFGLVNAAAAPVATETVVTPTVATPRVLTAAESKALATGRTLPASTAVDTPAPAPTDATGDVKKLAADQKTFVDAQILARKLKDTPANRKLLRAEYQKTAKPADDMAWMEIFRKDYPSYSDWTTSAVTEHFGQDFMDILNTIATGTTEISDEEKKALLKNTKYFTAATDKQYFFDSQRKGVQDDLVATARRAITTDYADVGLSETDLADLSKTVARSGLTGTGLKQAVYQYAFRRAAAAPTATDTKMATNVLQGADADLIRQNARAYGYAVSDAEVQAALTGGMYNGVAVSSESILQKAQKAAKGAYGHLSDQIDAGLSLSDIFENYKRYAANVLELDESQIDFTKDPKWQSAFGTKESGQMGLGDWVTKLKSDESFGWQYTKQANQQATDIGLTLARAFGKVK